MRALTRAYAAATPPNPATFMWSRSRPSSNPAIAHAGTWIGMGIIVSFAAGLAKIIEKMRPRKMESLPACGLTCPYIICWTNNRPEPNRIERTIPLAKNTFPCIIPRL